MVEASSGGVHGTASVTVAPPPSSTSSYTVNDSGDAPLDSAIGPGETSTGKITLRSAIEQVNIDGGGSITFAGSMNITVNSQLDAITAPGVTIDGGSPGSVVISGASGYNGLVIKGGGATIQNLVVDHFLVGISLQSSQNTIQDDFIGTDATGLLAAGNVTAGIEDTGGNNTIKDNLVSGNLGAGIVLDGASQDQVYGNTIGATFDETGPLGNKAFGLEIENGASNNTIGGLTSHTGVIGPESNVFDDNDGDGAVGVDITGAGTSGNLVEGNLIGYSTSQSVSIVQGASDNTIGGEKSGAGNSIIGSVIVGSDDTDKCRGDAILENRIVGSIDLGDDGPTPNNASGHSGPNLFQNFPDVSSAVTNGEVVNITGSLSAAPDTTYRIELFQNFDFATGGSFVTSIDVTTDSSGVAFFTAAGPDVVGPEGPDESVTATATDPAGNTSEFSPLTACQFITSHLPGSYIVNDPGDDPLDPFMGPGETSSGTITLRSAIEQANLDGILGESIGFAFPMDISVSSQLDAITAPDVTIDGGAGWLCRNQWRLRI